MATEAAVNVVAGATATAGRLVGRAARDTAAGGAGAAGGMRAGGAGAAGDMAAGGAAAGEMVAGGAEAAGDMAAGGAGAVGDMAAGGAGARVAGNTREGAEGALGIVGERSPVVHFRSLFALCIFVWTVSFISRLPCLQSGILIPCHT